ncbi:hypothetical protein PVAP13_1KG503700 [Panicum virgatum]|uniref:Uncharacterized protein n=1 Tax=Panicum virgatum TaxID=38727 RepID=A0A8T0Y1Z9_PANVG|nr:hypothetical protein PVAP13_1KG503700 [Panicum virgatum]
MMRAATAPAPRLQQWRRGVGAKPRREKLLRAWPPARGVNRALPAAVGSHAMRHCCCSPAGGRAYRAHEIQDRVRPGARRQRVQYCGALSAIATAPFRPRW